MTTSKLPNARFINANPSYELAPYHAMKNSIEYAYPTILPVAKVILQMLSMCFWVMRSCKTVNRTNGEKESQYHPETRENSTCNKIGREDSCVPSGKVSYGKIKGNDGVN